MSGAKYRRVADQIVARIERGELRPGDTLPSVRELEAEHGNSTAKAIHRWLKSEGWAEATPGAGTVVAERLPKTSDARIAELEAQVVEMQRRIDALESSTDPELRDRVGRMEAELADLKAVGRSPRQSGTGRRRASG